MPWQCFCVFSWDTEVCAEEDTSPTHTSLGPKPTSLPQAGTGRVVQLPTWHRHELCCPIPGSPSVRSHCQHHVFPHQLPLNGLTAPEHLCKASGVGERLAAYDVQRHQLVGSQRRRRPMALVSHTAGWAAGDVKKEALA